MPSKARSRWRGRDEPDALQGGETALVHAAEQRVEGVVGVVELDAGLAWQGAHDAPDVLDHPAAP